MKKTETYKLGKIKQLVDLNGDVTNFDLTFNVNSKDGSEFEAVVVDQATLDNNPNIEYKKAPGTISGNIVADKNVYQNYFLLLKSESPCECVVSTELKNIQPNAKYIKESLTQKTPQNTAQSAPPTKSSEKSKFDYKKILLILVLIGLAAFVYFKFFKKSKSADGKIEDSKDHSEHNSIVSTPAISKPTTPYSRPKDICTPSKVNISTTPISIQTPPSLLSKKTESLFDKLKGLPNIKKTI